MRLTPEHAWLNWTCIRRSFLSILARLCGCNVSEKFHVKRTDIWSTAILIVWCCDKPGPHLAIKTKKKLDTSAKLNCNQKNFEPNVDTRHSSSLLFARKSATRSRPCWYTHYWFQVHGHSDFSFHCIGTSWYITQTWQAPKFVSRRLKSEPWPSCWTARSPWEKVDDQPIPLSIPVYVS